MDISALGQLISSVGFPIAIVCYLLYYQKDTTDKLTSIISENTKAIALLQQEIHQLSHVEERHDTGRIQDDIH